MVRIIVCTLRGEPQQILSDEAVFSVEKLKEHLGVLDQGCFLSTIVHNNAALDDATDLAAFSQPVEVNLVQHASHWSPHLLSAARGPDISEVEGALRRFADPNSQDDNGWTALSFAACRGDIDMVKLLCKAGADPELGPDDNAPLHLAVREGCLRVVDYLLVKRCDVNQPDSYGVTPLQVAAEEGHEELLASLCEAGADMEATDDENVTPLLEACRVGEVGAVKSLLERRAEVDKVTLNGSSAQDLLMASLRMRQHSAEKALQIRELARDLNAST
ncbi:Kidins220 [Symbiodinium natans]|uniref:Kidins220 protein n=1 Tax=Symbiodinium natans TaxID=878477 RepID=A0A812G900_9DINO|nr:Kidins220 [Symbiodinium natans]